MKVLALVLLFAGAASAQSLEVQGGASNLFQADGIQLLWSQGNLAAEADAGLAGDHLGLGAGVHWLYRGCDVFAGDHQVFLSTASTGVSATVRGFTATCKSKTRSLTVFSGATGVVHSTPYYSPTSASHFGSGAVFWQKFGDFKYTLVAAADGNKRTLLEGLEFKDGPIYLEETAGFAQAAPYAEGQASFRRRHFAVNANRIDVIGLATVTSEGATVGWGNFSAFTSLFQSKSDGEAVGINFHESFLTSTVSETWGSGHRHNNAILMEKISRRFTASEFVQDGRSVNFGGDMRGNLVSGGLSWNELYTPTGFQKAATVNVRFQLPRLTINAAVTVLPGRIYYSGWAGMYLQGASLATAGTNHMAE